MQEIGSTFWLEQARKFLDGFEKHNDPEFLTHAHQRLAKIRLASDK